MISYDSIQELVDKAKKKGKLISELILEDQAMQMEQSQEELFELMRASLQVMAEAAAKGLTAVSKSASGLSGGDANKMRQSVDAGRSLSGKVLSETLAKALAIAEAVSYTHLTLPTKRIV